MRIRKLGIGMGLALAACSHGADNKGSSHQAATPDQTPTQTPAQTASQAAAPAAGKAGSFGLTLPQLNLVTPGATAVLAVMPACAVPDAGATATATATAAATAIVSSLNALVAQLLGVDPSQCQIFAQQATYQAGTPLLLSNVPAGPATVIVAILDQNGQPTEMGEGPVTIVPGQQAPVNITIAPINAATGSVLVTISEGGQPVPPPAPLPPQPVPPMTPDSYPAGYYTGYDGADMFAIMLDLPMGAPPPTIADPSIATIQTVTVAVQPSLIANVQSALAQAGYTTDKVVALLQSYGTSQALYRITPVKAGATTIGTDALVVNPYTPDQVALGKNRYNNAFDAANPACADCHLKGADGAPPHALGDIAHLPDVAAAQWITTGTLGQRTSRVPHAWKFASQDELNGTIAYVRSLATSDPEQLILLKLARKLAKINIMLTVNNDGSVTVATPNGTFSSGTDAAPIAAPTGNGVQGTGGWSAGPGLEACNAQGLSWLAVTNGGPASCGDPLASYCCTETEVLRQFPDIPGLQAAMDALIQQGMKLYNCSVGATGRNTFDFVTFGDTGDGGYHVQFKTIYVDNETPKGGPSAGACTLPTSAQIGVPTSSATSTDQSSGGPVPVQTAN